jgi:integrase
MTSKPNRRRLTDLWVQQTKVPGTTWDVLLPSFGLRVGARTKTWIIARRRGGSPHPVRVKIGRYPAMRLAEARERARREMGSQDPDPITLGQAVLEFLAHGMSRKGKPLRETSLDQYRRNLNRYAARLSARPLAEITRRDVAQLLHEVAETSGATTASLVRAMLGRLWSWSIEQGYLEYSVVAGTSAYEVTPRSRTLSDAEIRALWQATETDEDFHLICRICLWCGCRRSEAGGFAWSELTDGIWRVPGSRVKNGVPLVLPIPRQMTEVLAARPREHRDLLFGRGARRGFTNWSDAKRRLDNQLRFNSAWGLHDLRRSTETRLAELGVAKEVRDRILNHDVGAIARAYDRHDYRTEKGKALQRWADEIERIVHKA